jgi:hypothetical protein
MMVLRGELFHFDGDETAVNAQLDLSFTVNFWKRSTSA